MISESYFHVQAMRINEAKRWFGLLKAEVLECVSVREDTLRDYSPAWPKLAEEYEVGINSVGDDRIELANGTTAIDIHVNDPIGWLTVVLTKKAGFSERCYRGAISAEFISAASRPAEPDKYLMRAIGFLAGATSIRQVADKLSDSLYQSELMETDCDLSNSDGSSN